MRFIWDPLKARINNKKHRVSFEEALTVFMDPQALRIFDPDHSVLEERWVLLGLSSIHRYLVVIHVEKDEDVFRLVSARKANKGEIKKYLENL